MQWTEILNLARAHRDDDVRELALKASSCDTVDMPAVLRQISGQRIARDKIPDWASNDNIVYGPHLAMEQCSSQTTALYKAALVIGDTITDLTGGLGVDFAFMTQGRVGTYVERQQLLCDIARHNFSALRLNATVVNGDAADYLNGMSHVDTLYIDPARRDNAGNRVFALADCTPDVTSLAHTMLLKARRVIIKLSPMLDHRAAVAALPCVSQVHILSTRNECKELILVLDRDYNGDVTVHCVNDDQRQTFVLGQENITATVWNETTPSHLYEPNASIMQAGSCNLLASELDLSVVSHFSHLLVGDRLVPGFPGRTFAVDDVGSMNKKELRRFMQGITQANVITRNFPLRAAQLARRLKVSDGGDTYILATTTASARHILFKAHRL